jgi:hypothetical protein
MQAKNILLTRIKLRHTALVTAYGNTTKNIKSYDIVMTYTLVEIKTFDFKTFRQTFG